MDDQSRIHISADFDNLTALRQFVHQRVAAYGVDPDTLYDVTLAIEEAFTNIIMHGYCGQPGGIEIQITRADDTLLLQLRDQAPPFDPTGVPSPDTTLPLQKRPLGGLGIHLIRQTMDEISYCQLPQGSNELTLIKYGICTV